MRIAFVSPYPPAECGIGNYTHELVSALSAQRPELAITVLAERVPGVPNTTAVRRVWERGGAWGRELLPAIDALRPDLVHVQHEEGILGQGTAMLNFVHHMRARGIDVVITLHSVYATLLGGRFHRKLAAAGATLIVHQRTGMADVLAGQRVPAERIAVIPHGTPTLVLPDRTTARAALGLAGDGPIVLFYGFIHPKKCVHVAIAAFEKVASRHPGARLVIAGRIRRRWFVDALYARALRRAMRSGISAGRIVFRPGFTSNEDRARYYAAADLVVLPHRQRYGSASGVLHEALAARRPFICSRGKKFAEAVESLAEELPEAFPPAGDVDAWARGLDHLLGAELRRARMAELIDDLADATSWSRSAALHLDAYDAPRMRGQVATSR